MVQRATINEIPSLSDRPKTLLDDHDTKQHGPAAVRFLPDTWPPLRLDTVLRFRDCPR